MLSCHIKSLLLSAAVITTSRRSFPPGAVAMSTSSSTTNQACGNGNDGGKSALIFLHGLGDVRAVSYSIRTQVSIIICENLRFSLVLLYQIFSQLFSQTPAGWSSLEYQLPSIRKCLGEIHYVFPPAPTIGLTINGGMGESFYLLYTNNNIHDKIENLIMKSNLLGSRDAGVVRLV